MSLHQGFYTIWNLIVILCSKGLLIDKFIVCCILYVFSGLTGTGAYGPLFIYIVVILTFGMDGLLYRVV